MKSIPILSAVVLSLLLSGLVCAGTKGEIVLTDGSMIYGEILALDGGVYTIRSSTMGDLKIDGSKIREIRFGSHSVDRQPAEEAPASGMNPETKEIQKSLLGNPDILSIILGLQEDPEFQKILNDPGVMNSVLSGDVESLMSNPKFLQILNHPKVKEIQKKMAR